MSHPSYNGRIGEPFIELFTIDSTNNYAMARAHEGLAKHGATWFAHHQTAGKGQRNKSWATEAGQNITMSCVMEPGGPNITRPFLLVAATALACYDFFNDYCKGDVSIKWPNDIYWRDRKAGGILIENIYRANEWQFAVAGMGLNINQESFPAHLPNPVSLKQVTGRHYELIALAKELCERLTHRYAQFASNNPVLMEDYNHVLYKLDETVRLKKDNIVFQTTIQGVTALGQLITQDAIERQFEFGEVEWLL
ncbi:MAG TPA: biotin--[acetyl-CoA-carboxylase] ligase [Chitinophagaceae bacterium]|nr:biotin--[acetyl-CoA-carboxylase] ligase [Chitinophagaceae bacterium]